jgi:hypothetical protein
MTQILPIPAIRYNNPGNVSLPIEGWKGPGVIVGIKGQPGYAHFPSMKIGYQVALFRIASYIKEGRNTLLKIAEAYATDPAWGREVSQMSGISLDTPLSANSTFQVKNLTDNIIHHETGKTVRQMFAEVGETYVA